MFVSATLAGCNPVAGIQKRESMTQLEAATNTYRKLMRWGHFDQAAQYLRANGEAPLAKPDLEDMARFKVTSYTVADQLVADTRTDARVTAYVEFYNIDTGVTNSVRDEQFWWYDKDTRRWYLGSPMLDFAANAD
jgi:hypothetical protein